MSPMRSPHVLAIVRHLLLALLAGAPAAALAQSSPAVSTIVAFSGSQASNGVAVGPDGALYGTTALITTATGGLIYRAEANGSGIRTIYQLKLTDGLSPVAGLTLGSDGLFYGTTTVGSAAEAGSAGTVYRLAPDGSGFTVLHRFQSYTAVNIIGSAINADGAVPEAELVEGSDGYLYGVARAGGPAGTGVVFRMSRDGTAFAVLHTFGPIISGEGVFPATNADGLEPVGGLVAAADGYFYGTASGGGVAGSGTLFRIRFDGTGFEVVYTFTALETGDTDAPTNADGARPIAGLTDGLDGRLYGVASGGGNLGFGTVFAFDPLGRVLTVLHHFSGNDGARPGGELLLAQDGTLYGTTTTGGTTSSGATSTFGTIFSLARDGTGFSSRLSFEGSNGSSPTGRLVQTNPSTIVGIATSGGRCSQGVLYQFSLTGETVKGVTNCGRKKNSGGGSTGPAALVLLGALALLRRRRAG